MFSTLRPILSRLHLPWTTMGLSVALEPPWTLLSSHKHHFPVTVKAMIYPKFLTSTTVSRTPWIILLIREWSLSRSLLNGQDIHSFWYSDFLLLLIKLSYQKRNVQGYWSYLFKAPGCFTPGTRNECDCMCSAHLLAANRTWEISIINDHMQLVGCSDLLMYPTSTVKLQWQCGSHVTILLGHDLAFCLSFPQ